MLIEHVEQWSDLEIVPGLNGGNKTSLHLTIRHAKHRRVSRPTVFEITSKLTNCPVAHICRYLHTRGSTAGPLFIFADKSSMSRTYFASQLSACLSQAGYDPGLYKCHSFRIGAATRGLTDRHIQIMGRWKSAAYMRYIRIPMMQFRSGIAM